jgi:WD40 repeat protein
VLRLKGDFDVDTISADGASLFLIEHLGATRYVIRLYDLRRAVLVDGALTSKGSDKIMAGYAWGGVASPDGSWLLTLYVSTRRNVAFIHALNLTNSSPVCIDLPSGSGEFAELRNYALTLSPDGQHVYAANPALGVVADVDLAQLAVARTYSLPSRHAGGRASAAVSGDGRMLYVASGRRLWALDSAFGVVRGPYRAASEVVGIGVSRDDRLLYAAKSGGGVLVLDARNGAPIEA